MRGLLIRAEATVRESKDYSKAVFAMECPGDGEAGAELLEVMTDSGAAKRLQQQIGHVLEFDVKVRQVRYGRETVTQTTLLGHKSVRALFPFNAGEFKPAEVVKA